MASTESTGSAPALLPCPSPPESMFETAPPATAAFLSGGGQMGARMRAHDWSSSPLGWPETWPQALRSVASLMLGFRY